MAVSQKRALKKETGKIAKEHRKKKKHSLGGLPIHTKVKETKSKAVRTIGGNHKTKLLTADTVNLFDGKKHQKAKIKSVVENPANRHFVRRNILTKGTVVETDKGKARITSRPGQQGSVDAILVK